MRKKLKVLLVFLGLAFFFVYAWFAVYDPKLAKGLFIGGGCVVACVILYFLLDLFAAKIFDERLSGGR